ncbi:blood vessel epicardial substance isoform X2 [Lingula anatina]|uniref:Blood vessel epicardial substance isoform X2 n=1 Tax=Lingula anatina TaxID=7574 RepID=A0A1S3ID95_LINAN|nr:blood vessel epicardial substance isoform X2 [Lingula anatina]|eukprot:XP_013396235.1 blood vessel epicardial substance isoform X2 [Lingula anatina]
MSVEIEDSNQWAAVFITKQLLHFSEIKPQLTSSNLTGADQISKCRDLDLLYQKLFKPYHVPRAAFRELTSFGELRTYQDGETYAEETASVCGQYLSIVVSGRFSVSCEEFELHPIHPHQFLDSPEFEACAPEVIDKQKHFQVTITATEDSCIFQWDAAALRTFLKTHIFLETIFSMLIGKDITAKLHAVQQKIFQRNSTQQPLLITHSSSLLEIRNQILSGNHVDAMAALQRYANACRNAEHHCDGRSSISSVSISSPGPSMKIPVITKETCV